MCMYSILGRTIYIPFNIFLVAIVFACLQIQQNTSNTTRLHLHQHQSIYIKIHFHKNHKSNPFIIDPKLKWSGGKYMKGTESFKFSDIQKSHWHPNTDDYTKISGVDLYFTQHIQMQLNWTGVVTTIPTTTPEGLQKYESKRELSLNNSKNQWRSVQRSPLLPSHFNPLLGDHGDYRNSLCRLSECSNLTISDLVADFYEFI